MIRMSFSIALLLTTILTSAASALPMQPRETAKHVHSIVTVPGQPYLSAEQISALEAKVAAFPARSILVIYQAGAPAEQMPPFVDSLLERWHREQPQLYDPGKDCVGVLSYFPTTVVFRPPTGLSKDYQQVYQGLYGDPLARTVATLSQMSNDLAQLEKNKQEQEAAKLAAEKAAHQQLLAQNLAQKAERDRAKGFLDDQLLRLGNSREEVAEYAPKFVPRLNELLAQNRDQASLAELWSQTREVTDFFHKTEEAVAKRKAALNTNLWIAAGVSLFLLVMGYVLTHAWRIRARHRLDLAAILLEADQLMATLPRDETLAKYRQKQGTTLLEFNAADHPVSDCAANTKRFKTDIATVWGKLIIHPQDVEGLKNQLRELQTQCGTANDKWHGFTQAYNHAIGLQPNKEIFDPREGLWQALRDKPPVLELLLRRPQPPALELEAIYTALNDLKEQDPLGFVGQLAKWKDAVEKVKNQFIELGQLYSTALRQYQDKRREEAGRPHYVDDLLEGLLAQERTVGNILLIMQGTVAFRDRTKR